MPAVVAGQIGSNLFTVFELEPTYQANVIEVIKRPGTDYHAYKVMGIEYPDHDLSTQQQFTTHALALAALATYQTYVGTNQTFIRGATTYGTYKILKLLRVSPPRFTPRMIGDPGGNTSGFIVEATFKVQRQA